MNPAHRFSLIRASLCLLIFLGFTIDEVQAARMVETTVLDRDYLLIHLSDGDVFHVDEGNKVEQVVRHTPELNTTIAAQLGSWTISSADDASYGETGRHPLACYRKKKLSGHAEMEWSMSDNDFRYEYTYDHWIYLHLPSPLQQGATYRLDVAPDVNSDTAQVHFIFDQFSNVSEAIHVNLVGYSPDAPHKGADLYHWMGNGGARNYTAFEGNTVYLYNVDTQTASPIGTVEFWRANQGDVYGYNLTGSDVWKIDFSSATAPGTFRLVVEGVGCSRDFTIAGDVYASPFTVSLLGYFYMRIGDTNPNNIYPPPRTPLYLPEVSPPSTKVYLTTMHPFHPNWNSFVDGDKWDKPDAWRPYVKSGPPTPTNPDAWGGHSDAADWDRHLGHVANIYDLLLPYLMSGGAIDDDDLGISESGNTIPDIIDEARNEVDFWLRLRDGEGYSHGLTNPNGNNELFQAGPTALAAWANAANAAMLADAFRIAGLGSLMNHYRDAAIEAYDHASGLANQMLDEFIYLDEGHLRGRDLKMTAAAFLYNVTGDAGYEAVINSESVCATGPSRIQYFQDGNNGINQLYGTAAYLITPHTVHFPALYDTMKNQIISEAKTTEADLMNTRPSRRSTYHPPSYWRTAHFVGRSIVAHAVSDSQEDRDYFRKALNLEADWGLGRNPLNIIEMTTATTPLADKRSITEAATSGREDDIPGVHPGHTPYLNLEDWWDSMVMGRPSELYANSYPADFKQTWPRGEAYLPSRWVYAHTEYTPRQTMKGKVALYGYLHSLADTPTPVDPSLSVVVESVAGGTGTVTSVPTGIDCGNDCGQAFAVGTTVTLVATADAGSIFSGWDGACYGNESSCEVAMSMNRSVTARFRPEGLTYPLTVTLSGTGEGSVASEPVGIQCGSTCTAVYPATTTVTLTPVAHPGSSFTGWSGSCSGTSTCEIAMNAPRSVTATFRSDIAADLIIYDDALATGWQNWSWGGSIDYAATNPVHEGSNAINVTLDAWGGFSPAHPAGNIDTNGYRGFSFWVHGGSGADKQLRFFTEGPDGASTAATFTALAGSWHEVSISLADLGNPASFDRFSIQNYSGNTLPQFTLDLIRLAPLATGPQPGDVNDDGSIDVADAIVALKILVNSETFATKEADVSGDMKIGAAEAIHVLREVSRQTP